MDAATAANAAIVSSQSRTLALSLLDDWLIEPAVSPVVAHASGKSYPHADPDERANQRCGNVPALSTLRLHRVKVLVAYCMSCIVRVERRRRVRWRIISPNLVKRNRHQVGGFLHASAAQWRFDRTPLRIVDC